MVGPSRSMEIFDFASCVQNQTMEATLDMTILEISPIYTAIFYTILDRLIGSHVTCARVLKITGSGKHLYLSLMLKFIPNMQVFDCENSKIDDISFYDLIFSARSKGISLFEIRASNCIKVHFNEAEILDILCYEYSLVRVFKLDNGFVERGRSWDDRIIRILTSISECKSPVEVLGVPRVAWMKIEENNRLRIIDFLAATFINNICMRLKTPMWLRATLAANGKKSIGPCPSKWMAIFQSDEAVNVRMNLITFLLCNNDTVSRLPKHMLYYTISFFPHYFFSAEKPSWV